MPGLRISTRCGHDRSPAGSAERIPGPIVKGAVLERLRRNAFGEYELFFAGARAPEKADAVVLAMPFSVLRDVVLEDSLAIGPDKRRAIQELVYGANAKAMVGFQGRPWWERYGARGEIYSDRPDLQYTWESSWTTAGPTSVLVDYAGGDRGVALQVGTRQAPLGCSSCHGGGPRFFDIDGTLIQQQVGRFVSAADQVLPGLAAAASRTADGKYRVVRGHWLVQRYSKGSYASAHPGYFTTIAGLEPVPVGLLKFAGCHTDSFYEYQGYMEGACRSGIRAAREILADIQAGRL